MADRALHRRVLIRRALLALALVVVTLAPAPARAHNSWTGGYRKFPWKASAGRTLTTLPGECPHCPAKESSSAWKAIDVGDMDYDTVYAIAPGVVDGVDLNGGTGAGIYIRIKDNDGTYVTYAHLDSVLVARGDVIVAGQPLAVSGNTGNSTGPHLHFQRQSGTSFGSTALDLVPISSHGESGDELSSTIYTSDNAGIGYTSSGVGSAPFRETYARLGGYRHVGITANVGEAWTPCRDGEPTGTWWRYGCSGDYPGSVQTLYHQGKPRALTLEKGGSTAYLVHRGILGAYTAEWNGHDWVAHIGFPRGNRYVVTDGWYKQNFENGAITMSPSQCIERVYVAGGLKATYGFCD